MPRTNAVVVRQEKEVDDSDKQQIHLNLCCWHMPYCRPYLRKFCKAFEERKSCWRSKSGCYCDEDLLIRAMKKNEGAPAPPPSAGGFDQRYTQLAGKNLSPAQKRARCRQCFLYEEHQKHKYRMLSPLVFPIVALLMWVYYSPVKSWLDQMLSAADKFAGFMSFGASKGQMVGNQWGSTAAASGVDWICLICLGLVIATYMLRGLEYLIFELQV